MNPDKGGNKIHRKPTVKIRVPVYEDSEDSDQRSITHQVRDYPDIQKSRTSELMGEIEESKYNELFHRIYDAVVLTDTEGNIFEANARAEYNFVYPREDLNQMSVLDLISGADEHLIETICDNVSNEKYVVVEATCARADDSRFDAEIVIHTLNRGTDKFALCFFFRDVTTRKEAEQKLAETNARLLEQEKINARLSTVATLVAEINNPLQVLTSIGESDPSKEISKQVNRIITVLNRLHTDKPLPTVTDDQGGTMYDLPVADKLVSCDHGRILVVDDEMMLRQMFTDSLAHQFPGFAVDAAVDGEHAVEAFTKGHHCIIIMDCAMPMMTGEEAYDAIMAFCAREGWKTPAFIFCTGFVLSDKLKDVIGDESVNTILKKPFTTGDLARMVRQRLQMISEDGRSDRPG